MFVPEVGNPLVLRNNGYSQRRNANDNHHGLGAPGRTSLKFFAIAESGLYAPDLSSQHEHILEGEHLRICVHPWFPVVAFWRVEPVILGDTSWRRTRAAYSLQPRPSCGR